MASPRHSVMDTSSKSPVRFVLDLRHIVQPSVLSNSKEDIGEVNTSANQNLENKCARLEAEIKKLRESEGNLIGEVKELQTELDRYARGSDIAGELARTKLELKRLQEDYQMALELIVTLSATLTKPNSSENSERIRTHSNASSSGKKSSMKGTPDGSRPPFVPAASAASETFNANVLGVPRHFIPGSRPAFAPGYQGYLSPSPTMMHASVRSTTDGESENRM